MRSVASKIIRSGLETRTTRTPTSSCAADALATVQVLTEQAAHCGLEHWDAEAIAPLRSLRRAVDVDHPGLRGHAGNTRRSAVRNRLGWADVSFSEGAIMTNIPQSQPAPELKVLKTEEEWRAELPHRVPSAARGRHRAAVHR